jgi:proline dehydrogenase
VKQGLPQRYLNELVEVATRLGRAQAYLEYAREKLDRLYELAAGGAFVSGTYDAPREVERRSAEVARIEDELRALRDDA